MDYYADQPHADRRGSFAGLMASGMCLHVAHHYRTASDNARRDSGDERNGRAVEAIVGNAPV
jgi:hypothetical protein